MSHSRLIKGLLALMLLIAPGIYIFAEGGTTKDYIWLLLLGNPAPDVRKAPYLIYEGEKNSRMTVLWQLHNTTKCKIEWGTDTSYATGSGTTSQYGDDHQHSYRITGLTPGTGYLYRVSCGEQEIGSGSFRAAPPDGANSVKLMVYGDSRAEDGPTPVYATHDEVLAEMINVYDSDDPDYQSIALQTGDWVDFGATEKSWDEEMFSDETPNIREFLANVPIAGTIGNHDLLTQECEAWAKQDQDNSVLECYSAATFDKYFPYPYGGKDHYWSFDYGPVHIAMVNINVDRKAAGPGDVCYRHYVPFYEGSEQYNWLVSDLASTTKPWKIVIFHEQGYSAGYKGTNAGHQCLEPDDNNSNNNNKDVQRIIQPLLETHSVDLVFTGNNHYYARAVKSGVTHVTAAGGGAPLYNRDPSDPDDPLYFPDLCYVHKHVKANHFIKLDIQGDTLNYQVINVEEASESSEYTPIGFAPGDVIESLVLTKGAGGPYEAEAADWNPPSRLLDPEDSDHSGWGYIGYLGDGEIEWTIDVQEDDSNINLFIGYALGQDETREMFSYLDNERRDRIAFTYTGGWTEWDEMQRNSTITGVSKGCHKIRLEAVEHSSPNIDYLRVKLAE